MSTFTTRSFLLLFLLGVLVPAFESAPISFADGDKSIHPRISYADDKSVHPRKAVSSDGTSLQRRSPSLHAQVNLNMDIQPRGLHEQVPLNRVILPRRPSLRAQVPINDELRPRVRRSLHAQVPLNVDIEPREYPIRRRSPTAEPEHHRYGHKALELDENEDGRPPHRILRSHRRPHSKFNDFETSRGGRAKHVIPFTRIRVNWKHVNPFQSVSHTFSAPGFTARRQRAALRAKAARAKFASLAKEKAADSKPVNTAVKPESRPAVPEKASTPIVAPVPDSGTALQPRLRPSLWSRALKAAADTLGSWSLATSSTHTVETIIGGKKAKKETVAVGVASGPVTTAGKKGKATTIPAHIYAASAPGTVAAVVVSDTKPKPADAASPGSKSPSTVPGLKAEEDKPHDKLASVDAASKDGAKSAKAAFVPPTPPASPSGAGAGESGGGSLKKAAGAASKSPEGAAPDPDVVKPKKARESHESTEPGGVVAESVEVGLGDTAPDGGPPKKARAHAHAKHHAAATPGGKESYESGSPSEPADGGTEPAFVLPGKALSVGDTVLTRRLVDTGDSGGASTDHSPLSAPAKEFKFKHVDFTTWNFMPKHRRHRRDLDERWIDEEDEGWK